jgi:hypothetical protein
MKNFLMLLMCVSLVWACNDVRTKKEEEDKTVETWHQHDEKLSTLGLNNGAKWKADERTNNNVAELKLIVSRFTKSKNKSVADYSALANDLQNSLNTLIKECRMQGVDHDALHQWLQTLIENVKNLKTVTTESEASQVFAEINNEVSAYNQYFE